MSLAVGEDQLAVMLQASLDRAKDLLEESGGFLPFAARANLSGAVEFLEIEGDGGGESIEALYERLRTLLAEDAQRGEILAASLVANASLPEDVAADFDTAVSVLVEARDFSRSIVAPYSFEGSTVEFGALIPEEAAPAIFSALS